MTATDDRSEEELLARLGKIAEEMDALTREVTPKLIKLGHLRNESRSIISVLESRGGQEG